MSITETPVIAPAKIPHPDTLAPEPEDAPDDQHLAHIADSEEVMRAYLLREPVTALCGYTWVPERDPEKYPVCPRCSEIFKAAFGKDAPGA